MSALARMSVSENLKKCFWVFAGIIVSAPFIWLALQNMPASDDYYDYYLLQRFGPFEAVYHYYLNWSGRFVSHFLAFCLNPLQLGERVGPAITGIVGILILWFTAFKVGDSIHLIFKDQRNRLSTSILIGVFWLCFLPYPAEIIFWFTGMIAYQPGLAMMAAFMLLHLRNSNHILSRIIYYTLPFLIAGTNEINVLIMGFLLALIFPINNWKSKNYWIVVSIFLFGAAIELLAPGSRYRMLYFTETAGNPVADLSFSISHSFKMLWHILRDWSRSTPILLVSILIALGIGVNREIKIHPIKMFFIFSGMLLIPLMYFPFFWGTGMTEPPGRLHDVVFLFFSVWCIGTTICIFQRFKIEISRPQFIRTVFFVVLLWQASYNSRLRGAISDLKLINSFRKELSVRTQKTAKHKVICPQKTLILPPLKNIPYTMFFGDLTSDPGHWYNEGYARFHKISEVVVEEDNRNKILND